MSFSSVLFAGFFLLVLAMLGLSRLPFLTKRISSRFLRAGRQWFLLVASYVFYGVWDWRFCFLMLALTAMAYLCALQVARGGPTARLWSILGVVAPLVVLGIFKYFHFFLLSFASLLGVEPTGALRIILPVGVSFYTFQTLSYVIDVIRGTCSVERSFRRLALYISFFPQLVAGPIVKAADFLPQLHEDRNVSLKGMEAGIQIFLLGLAKKIVLADWLSVFVDDVYAHIGAFGTATVWLAVVAYSLQIYLDFSGYSDMAIGCARCMGYDLKRNFNLPYLSRNISEFWTRWHISLSSWLKEYLYIPLGGNRRGNQSVNLLLTMLLGGLWHGAGWNFVLWGLLHGLALCVHKLWQTRFPRSHSGPMATALSTAGTYLFVALCWIPFRAGDLGTTLVILGRLFLPTPGLVQPFSWAFIAIAAVLLSTLLALYRSRQTGQAEITGYYPCGNLSKFWPLVLFFISWGIVLGVAYTKSNPFIYFQF